VSSLKENYGELIKEATIDCYGEYECLEGFYATLEDKLNFPFWAKAVGEKVKVIGVELRGNRILAVCRKEGKRYKGIF